MANIEKRGNSYRISVFLGRDESGKQSWERISFKPTETAPTKIKKEVEAFAATFEDQVLNGKYRTGNKLTFAEFYETWKADWAEKNLTLSVYEEYIRKIDKHFFPALKELPLNKIRISHIQPIINDLSDRYKISSVKYFLTAVNSVFRYAYSMDVIDENPCDRCSFPREKKTTYNDLHFFDIDQAKQFLNVALEKKYSRHVSERKRKDSNGNIYSVAAYNTDFCVDTQWKAYFYLAIYGGFRRGEMCALTWNDIDFDNKTVSINKAAARTRSCGQIVKETKTAAGVREIILPAACFKVLRKWKSEQSKLAMQLGSAWEGFRGAEYNNNNVFIQIDSGKMMDLATPSHKFKEILQNYNESCEDEADKLPNIHLHDLRHTSVTLLLANGIDVETAAHRHGHSNASVTMNVYGHWTKQADETASNKLQELFGS